MTNFNFTDCILTIACFCVWGIHSLEYNDLEALGVSCPTRDSCAVMRNKTFFERNCECDRRCQFYNDCCIDFHRRPRGPASSSHHPTNPTCMTFAGQNDVGVYTVAKCSEDFTGTAEVLAKCEHPSDMSDPFVAAPATDVRNNVTYRNMYCAECSGVKLENLSSWAINVQCENISPDMSHENITGKLVYKSDTDQWGIYDGNGGSSVFSQCDLVLYLPDILLGNVRLCRANVVSTCPKSWRRKSIKVKCMSYTAVVGNSNSVFKNPHCAVCNGVGLNSVTCEHGIFSRIKQPMSFAMLLDVNQNDGEMVGMTRQTCPANTKYDPFAKRCRNLVCGLPGYVMVNGKCVRS